jgi:hypothetical protein
VPEIVGPFPTGVVRSAARELRKRGHRARRAGAFDGRGH